MEPAGTMAAAKSGDVANSGTELDGILGLLSCPHTGESLHWAEPSVVEKLEALRVQSQLKDRSGQPVQEVVGSLLVNAGGQWAYPVRNGIPVLLPEAAIPL